jgi:hypothetical protein
MLALWGAPVWLVLVGLLFVLAVLWVVVMLLRGE